VAAVVHPVGGRQRGSRPTLRLVPAGHGRSGRASARVDVGVRRLLAAAAIAAVVVGILVLRGALATPPAPSGGVGAAAVRPVAAQSYVVQPGDTLWSIARRMGVTGDLRPMVDRLAAETGHRPLQVGERVRLP